MERLSRLFEPIDIGSMRAKNRIVMTGIAITTVEDTSKFGIMHDRYVDFFEERARGGVGLIILPDTCVDRNLKVQSHPCIGGDEFNAGLSALTEAVHVWGAKIAPDLQYRGVSRGAHWRPSFPFGNDWRPLRTFPLFNQQASVEMDLKQIQEVQELFADAAARARTTCFDAIHIAGHYGFLIAQFLSPAFNKRSDKYGGGTDNRARFAVEIVEKIRSRIGDAVPIIFRLNADEFIPGGIQVEEAAVIARRLVEAGVDAINVATGIIDPLRLYHHKIIPPMGSPEGTYVDLAARIKASVSVPVIYAGKISDPLFAEKLLAEGKVDMVGMARQLLADPLWPQKAQEGRSSDIAPCIACNVCLERLVERRVSRCSVNADVGREREFRITSALRPLRVSVVGGGPAGMEAARVAALRGHKVRLYEKGLVLGGQLILSSKPPFKQEIQRFQDYLVKQVRKAGVEIKLGTEASAEEIKSEGADVVILATGGLPCVPDFPGARGANVSTAWEVLSGKEVGKVVVIVGGGMVGCETAEFLAHQGKQVTIVEMLPEIASDVERLTIRNSLLERFSKYDIELLVNSRVTAVNGDGAVVSCDGQQKPVRGDSVVLAVGTMANDALAVALRGVPHIYTVGDCSKPGRIVDAVNQAARIAREI